MKLAPLVVFALTLTACSGGGGGNSAPSTAPVQSPAPTPTGDFPPTTGTPSCTNVLPGQFSCVLGSRSYLLYVPASYGAGTKAVPLVVDMHGYTSTAEAQRAGSGWSALAATQGFIVAYPQGEGNAWNAQGVCCGPSTVDDVQFIRSVVADIRSHARILGDRIFATGLSNGGSMAHTLACASADVFAGVAPVSYPLSGGSSVVNGGDYAQIVASCRPSRPIAVIAFQGRVDATVPYSTRTGDLLTAQESRRAWAEIEHCSMTTTTNPVAGMTCEISSGCDGGARTALCSVDNGTHVLYGDVGVPGIPTIAWEFFAGK